MDVSEKLFNPDDPNMDYVINLSNNCTVFDLQEYVFVESGPNLSSKQSVTYILLLIRNIFIKLGY